MKLVRFIAAAVALTSAGCFSETFTTGLPAGGGDKVDSATFFVYGLVGEKDLDLSSLCPSGVSTWKQVSEPVDVILTYCTCGLYFPQTVEVTCSGGAKSSYLLTPDEKNHRTLVQPETASCRIDAQRGGRS